MRKRIISAVALTALALTGCVSADREAGTAEVEPWVVSAELYGTSVELERGLYECEQAYPVPADHAPDHPMAAPLAECVAQVYEVSK